MIIKKYTILSLVISCITYSSVIIPAYSQEEPALPGDSLPQDAIQPNPDPNKIIRDAREGKIIPEQIKPFDDECADILNKSVLANGSASVPDDYKQNCPQMNQHKQKSKP